MNATVFQHVKDELAVDTDYLAGEGNIFRKNVDLDPLQDQSQLSVAETSPTQRYLSQVLEDQHLQEVLRQVDSDGDAATQVRLKSITRKHAGAWVGVTPSLFYKRNINNAAFLVITKHWLGIDQLPSPGSECPVCHKWQDPGGYHALTCGKGGHLTNRHHGIRNVLFNHCQEAGLLPQDEAPGLIPNSADRPADIYLPTVANGKGLVLDVAITHPLQKSNLPVARVVGGGAAVRYAIQVKDRRYKNSVEQGDYQ